MDKPALINKIKSLDGLAQDEKAALIDLLNQTKKYGLVWEDKPEAVEEQLRTQLPVLLEVPERRIMAEQLTMQTPAAPPDKAAPTPDLFSTTEPQTTEPQTPNTEHLPPNHILIEGDNLHALTALTFTHEGKIDLMYFDPPYNTGKKDFKYNDLYVDKEDSYRHSKWLSFMQKRLQIAHRLLSDKGVVFISIDDNEQAQLKMLCDEIFLVDNYITTFIWRTDGNFDNQAQVKNCHEYILCYSKNANNFTVNAVIDPNISDESKLYRDNIQNTIVKNGPKNPMSEVIIPIGFPTLFEAGQVSARTNRFPYYLNDVTVSDYKTSNETIVKSGWSSRTLLDLFIKNDFNPVLDSKNQLTNFKISETGSIEAIKVRADQSHVISVLMNMGNTQNNSNRLAEMGISFSYPKPLTLLEYIINIYPNKACSLLDIFAGSGTTLHATISRNAQDGGNRQCILVTNNENKIAEEVCYERNKRVIQGYTNSKGNWVDGLTNNNLRYYKTDFVGSARTEQNRRKLTRLSTALLQIKEDCYTDITVQNGFDPELCHVSTNERDRHLIVLYHSRKQAEVIEQLRAFIRSLPATDEKIKLYAFGEEKEILLDAFYDVAARMEAVPLPDAIYNAYRATFRSLKLERKAPVNIAAEAESESETTDDETKPMED